MSFENYFISVSGRPLPKEPMQFFNVSSNKKRVFLTIADNPSIWQKDLVIAERIFSETIICPYKDYSNHTIALNLTKNILKDRMKYPGVKEDPEMMAIAKTWILPDRLHLGPDASEFLTLENGPIKFLEPIFEKLQTDPILNYLKIEVGYGMERMLVYSILDSGFRPGLLCVKWSNVPDEHTSTAHCVGHLLNCGYALLKVENGYSLYHYNDDVLYDMCTVGQPSTENPFVKTICQSLAPKIQEDILKVLTKNTENQTETSHSSAPVQTNENTESKLDEGSS